MLEEQIQSPDVTAYQFHRYVLNKISKLSPPASAEQWTAEAARLRRRILNDIVFHGWPTEWIEAPARFEDLGPVACGKGYRMRKLRYEIVPGFSGAAILYEPETMSGKVPAILNVNGHVGAPGKAVEYKQKRCINQALRGMVALNLEWLGCGELFQKGNEHSYGAHLDLAGVNEVGLFYLAMRKGLDYLYAHPAVDRSRIGMTGLSGGGWQTIVLSALDERINAAAPVAGYASFLSRLERMTDIGDIEQNAADMFASIDYAHLTAMRAPRPTLLIYNAEDNCCFRSVFVKRENFDAVLPFFRLYGREDNLGWHENTDPADHNYQLDNRLQSYHFFGKHFGVSTAAEEIPAAEVKTAEDLTVGLPKENLTILDLARKLAHALTRPESASRELLKETVRFRPVEVERAWIAANTKRKELETVSYRLEFSNGLSAVATWLKAIASPANAPAAIVIADDGRKTAAAEVSARVNRGEQVLALDLVLTGAMSPAQRPGNAGFVHLLSTLGERALGVQAAQLIASGRWLQKVSGQAQIRIATSGIRTQVIALTAAALEPGIFADLSIEGGMSSLGHLFEAPVEERAAPELFCLDLYQRFDLDTLTKLASPAIIRQSPTRGPDAF
jgi:dienelactone hydrolase